LCQLPGAVIARRSNPGTTRGRPLRFVQRAAPESFTVQLHNEKWNPPPDPAGAEFAANRTLDFLVRSQGCEWWN
jgi:hypothetical protein